MPSNYFVLSQTAPVILTDDLFVAYGGLTGSSTAQQRIIAYNTAELQVVNYLKSFLLPTTTTGSYLLHPVHPVQLDMVNIISLDSATLYSRKTTGQTSCTFQTTSTCAHLRNAVLGIVDLNLVGSCGCASSFDPYIIEIAYTSGFTSGTVYNSSVLPALALAAQLELEEITGISETPGGVGITSWSNQEYSESRAPMKQTVFGSTPAAQRIVRLLAPYRVFRYAGL